MASLFSWLSYTTGVFCYTVASVPYSARARLVWFLSIQRVLACRCLGFLVHVTGTMSRLRRRSCWHSPSPPYPACRFSGNFSSLWHASGLCPREWSYDRRILGLYRQNWHVQAWLYRIVPVGCHSKWLHVAGWLGHRRPLLTRGCQPEIALGNLVWRIPRLCPQHWSPHPAWW